MRKIKFRALIEWPKQEAGWIYYGTISIPYAFDPPEDKPQPKIIVKDLQFTGLKDKNGKEIYEGDILEFTIWPDLDDGYSFDTKRIKDEIVFRSGCFSLKNRMDLLFSIQPTREPVVIGNIYENPELLK